MSIAGGRVILKLIRSFSIPCLLIGLLFFAASLTPSLIPRGPVVQGVLGGLVTAIGYLLGRTLALIWDAVDLPFLTGHLRRLMILLMMALIGAFFLRTLWYSLEWQNDLRAKMGIEPADAAHLVSLMAMALGTFILTFLIGAAVALLFRLIRRRLYNWVPPRRANTLGVVTVMILLFFITRDGLLDTFIRAMDESYENAQQLFDKAPPAPEDPDATGSPASLIEWAGLGAPGREFVTSGPDAADIAAFTGRAALDPIRVYVGRANGASPEDRAALALAELKRVGAFERDVLIVTSPTGTGWMDPGSHDPVEYMHNGNIATVSAQYSYLQSPLALLFETNTGLDQATALLEAVHEHWKTLREDARPRLYVHGLSLGAWSSMHATNIFRLINDPIDGAFWVGPPFSSALWNYVQRTREPDSSWVLPTIGDGSLVRYASNYRDALEASTEAEADWGEMRIVFLQYSSDPIVFYDPFSFFRPPVWMTEPPSKDVSDHLRFMPVVTQFQLALDMALSFGAPPGHGHAYYAQDYISPWIEVTAPAIWTEADTERLKAHCDLGFQLGCKN